MERFLNEETIQGSRTRVRRVKRVLYGLVILTAALFTALCLLTHTGNARTMLFLTMASTVLPGWGIIALWLFAAEPMKAEEQHLTGLAAVEPESREGLFFLDSDVFRIPKSVRVRKVRLETDDDTLSLNLNDKLTDKMPPDGSRVRVRIARKFITGLEVLESGPAEAPRRKSSGARKIFHALGRFFLPAVLWAMMAALVTGFVFNQITDTSPENKIVLYADCELQNAPVLAEKLEKALDGAVRMVKIHPFSYAMFDSDRLKQADLYIIPDSRAEEYRDWIMPGNGFPAYDPVSGQAVAEDCFLYDQAETYRLYIGNASVHLEDGLARKASELLLSMTDAAGEETP